MLGTIFTCYPVQKYWDFTVTEGKCLDRNAITFVNAGVNIATDLVLLAIPIPLLKNLQIPKKQKFILVGVFACGAFACAMSIIRLKALYEIGRAPQEQQSSMCLLEHSLRYFSQTPSDSAALVSRMLTCF